LLKVKGYSWESVQQDLNYYEHKKPCLATICYDFNISDSEDYEVCILSPDSRVGIDIECRQKVDLNDFARTMNQQQWNEIHQSEDSHDTFFKYWTMKESVIKADGRGLSIPLTDIIFDNNKVSYDGMLWYLYPFKIDSNHNGCAASSHKINDLQLVEVHWKDFLE